MLTFLVAVTVAQGEQALTKPFTLVYNFTQVDARTKAMRDKDLANDIAGMQQRLDADQISKEQMDDAVAKEREAISHPVTIKGVLTISFDGHTLLVDDAHPDTPADERVVIIRDGKTYTLSPGASNVVSMGNEGVVNYGLYELPIIGPSLPFMPTTKDGKFLDIRVAPDIRTVGQVNRLGYVQGAMMESRDNSFKKYLFGSNGKGDTMLLSRFTKVEGASIATNINWTLMNFYGGTPDQGLPRTQYEYGLVSSKSEALATEAFDPGHYMHDGGSMQVELPKGKSKTFTYTLVDGTFDQQLKSALSGSI